MEPYDFAAARKKLTERYGRHISSTDILSYCMYPKVFEDYKAFTEKYGDLSVVPTRYFIGKPVVGEEINSKQRQESVVLALTCPQSHWKKARP
jgi:pyruvate carboxylase